jgi:hypothetical protein
MPPPHIGYQQDAQGQQFYQQVGIRNVISEENCSAFCNKGMQKNDTFQMNTLNPLVPNGTKYA